MLGGNWRKNTGRKKRLIMFSDKPQSLCSLFSLFPIPSAVTPSSITNTVVDAIILCSSSSWLPLCFAKERPSESGSVTHRDSPQSSDLQMRMSHCKWTVFESGKQNMEYSFEVETPCEESKTNLPLLLTVKLIYFCH